jgi:N-acetylglucosaminyl-diphospho-decaprenol L-rhamnosyltransferase
MLTVVMPSFYSSKLVRERVKEIDKNTQILIIENSQDTIFKKNIENESNNVKVIIPEKNLGWGKAVNIGITEAKTEMVFVTQPDVMLIEDCIKKLHECIKTFKDFTVLSPYDTNSKIFKNYEIYKDYPTQKNYNEFLLEEVDYVDLSWLINKSKLEQKDLWDEQIFLYFEAKDFAKRLKDQNKKIFVAKNIKTYHLGSASHDKKLEFYSQLNRNWHYNWSRHYYNKKHFGNIYAFRKSISLMIKLILKFVKKIIFFKFKKSKLILIELYGLMSSMFNLSSFYRPYKNLDRNNL